MVKKTATLDDIAELIRKQNQNSEKVLEFSEQTKESIDDLNEIMDSFVKFLKKESAMEGLANKERQKEQRRSGGNREFIQDQMRQDIWSLLLGGAGSTLLTFGAFLLGVTKWSTTISALKDNIDSEMVKFNERFVAVLGSMRAIPLFVSRAFQPVINFAKSFGAGFQRSFPQLSRMLGGIVRWIDNTTNNISAIFTRMTPRAISQFVRGLGRMSGLILAIDAGIQTAFAALHEYMRTKNPFHAILEGIEALMNYAVRLIADTFKMSVNILGTVLKTAADFLGLTPMLDWIADIEIQGHRLGDILAGAKEVIFKLVDGFREFSQLAISGLSDMFKAFTTKEAFDQLFLSMKNLFENLITKLPQNAVNFTRNVFGAIMSTVSDTFEFVKNIFDQFKDIVSGWRDKFVGFLGDKLGIEFPERSFLPKRETVMPENVRRNETAMIRADTVERKQMEKRLSEQINNTSGVMVTDASSTMVNNTRVTNTKAFSVPPMSAHNQFDPAYAQTNF